MNHALDMYKEGKDKFIAEERGRRYKHLGLEQGKKHKRTHKIFGGELIDDDHDSSCPIVKSKVICPLCGDVSNQSYLQSSVYSVSKKDIDLKPIQYEWMNKDNSHINPLLYDIWECPCCHFCADRQHFQDPVCDVSGSQSNFRKKVKPILAENNEVAHIVKLFSTTAEEEFTVTYDVAIRRYMIAINILQHVDRVSKLDALPLGKYHLHLAWLYREIDQMPVNTRMIKMIMDLKAKAGHYWESIPITENTALISASNYYETAIYESTIDLMKETEHRAFQIVGRIQMKMGNYMEARRLFHEALKCIYQLKEELECRLRGARTSKYEHLYEEVIPKLHNINEFYIETQNLLLYCKDKMVAM